MPEAYELLDDKYPFIPKIHINSQTKSADLNVKRWNSVFGQKSVFAQKCLKSGHFLTGMCTDLEANLSLTEGSSINVILWASI